MRLAFILATLTVATVPPIASSQPRPTPASPQLTLIYNPENSSRRRIISTPDPNPVISLQSKDVLLVLYPDNRTAEIRGPINRSLSEARKRSIAEQSFFARLLVYFRQSRDTLKGAGTRAWRDYASSGQPPIQRPPVTSADTLPPVSITAVGVQCIIPSQTNQLWRERSSLAETYAVRFNDTAVEVHFEAGQAVADWSADLGTVRNSTVASFTPPAPFETRHATLKPIGIARNQTLLAALVEAGCEQQSQALVDLIYDTTKQVG